MADVRAGLGAVAPLQRSDTDHEARRYVMLPLPGAARMPAGPAESFALPVSLPWARFLLLVGAMLVAFFFFFFFIATLEV